MSDPRAAAAAGARARRSCGVCADDMDLFAQMRREINHEAQKTATVHTATTAAMDSAPSAVPAVASSAAASAAPATPLQCPLDSASLGRATWSFLHTMSAYYPDQPTASQQSRMSSFLTDFASFYPCPPCAEHFQQHLVKHPPPTHTRAALSNFLCRYHNDVNVRLGKKQFDCARYDERWRDGPKEGAGYDCVEEPQSNAD